MASAFDFLEPHPRLFRSARRLSQYAMVDANHALIEARKFAEVLTELLAAAAAPPIRARTSHNQQQELFNRGLIPKAVFTHLARCRQIGNDAVHGEESDARLVREILAAVHDLGAWFVRQTGGADPGPYMPDDLHASLDANLQEQEFRARLANDLRVPMTGFASRAARPSVDVESLFVSPTLGGVLKDWGDALRAVQTGQRAAIAGPAGFGKSTLCRALARALLEEPGGRVPLLLPLAGLNEAIRPSLLRRARDHLHVHLDSSTLEAWLAEGRAVVILDGLDEAEDPQGTADSLDALAEAYPGLGIVVTGRPIALNRVRLSQFPCSHLEGWSTWHARWFLERLLGGTASDRILDLIEGRTGLADLLSSPLLVTLLGLIWQEREEVPENRGALLDAAIRTMLETWPARRRRSFREFDLAEQRAHLERLARASVTTGFDGSFSGLTRALDKGVTGERWLEHLIDETGLLCASGPDRYQFFHLALRDRLALFQLLREGVDVVSFVVERATSGTHDMLAVDLVTSVRDQPGLATALILRFRERELPERGAWYGASRAWWLDLFREFVREGLPMDDDAADAMLRFIAEDRLRIYQAMNEHEPMRFGDENRATPGVGADSGIGLIGGLYLSVPPTDFVSEGTLDAWLRAHLVADAGESVASTVALALERLDEEEILQLAGERAGGYFWLWPRSPAGRIVRTKRARSGDEVWPIERLARSAARGIGLEHALVELEGKGDWLGRALSFLQTGGGPGLLEAIVVLILRQTLSTGLRGTSPLGILPQVLHSGPWPCLHLMKPRLGIPPVPGLGGELERFRGLVWLGWSDPELGRLVMSTGLRTPVGLMRFGDYAEWPDTSEVDALPLKDVVASTGVHGRLASRMGLLAPTMWMFDKEMRPLGPLQDSVPLTLEWGPERVRQAPPQKERIDPRQTWLAELVAASVVTRGMSADERARHLQQRLQCRATSTFWTLIEQRALAASEPGPRELLLPALLWAERSLTGTWAMTSWVERFWDSRPDGWLPRVFALLLWIEHPRVDQRTQRELRRQLKDLLFHAGGHPAAVLLRSALRNGESGQ